LVGREPPVESQDRAALALDEVLVIGGEQERHHRARGAGGRLDDVGRVALVRRLIEVVERDARGVGVLGQVVVAAIGDALEFVPAPRIDELHVGRTARIVREVLFGVLVQTELLGGDTQVEVPGEACLNPVAVPLLGVGRGDEVLHLHLLELAGAKDEVLRRDLVAKGLADLGDAEGRLLSHRREHVGEVREDALGRLGA